jgi:hypothetical protein
MTTASAWPPAAGVPAGGVTMHGDHLKGGGAGATVEHDATSMAVQANNEGCACDMRGIVVSAT